MAIEVKAFVRMAWDEVFRAETSARRARGRGCNADRSRMIEARAFVPAEGIEVSFVAMRRRMGEAVVWVGRIGMTGRYRDNDGAGTGTIVPGCVEARVCRRSVLKKKIRTPRLPLSPRRIAR